LINSIPPKSKLWPILFRMDVELRDKMQSEECKHCGKRLDRADYRRRPRGGSELSGDVFQLRLSLCCSARACRRRANPPSTRFLGRRVYLGPVIVLLSALRQGTNAKSLQALSVAFGVGKRTIQRWIGWWRDEFQSSPLWRLLRGRLLHAHEPVPRRLVCAFDAAENSDSLSRLMSFFCGDGL
jgi:hypothetical protein